MLLELPPLKADRRRAASLALQLAALSESLGYSVDEMGAACLQVLEIITIARLENVECEEYAEP